MHSSVKTKSSKRGPKLGTPATSMHSTRSSRIPTHAKEQILAMFLELSKPSLRSWKSVQPSQIQLPRSIKFSLKKTAAPFAGIPLELSPSPSVAYLSPAKRSPRMVQISSPSKATKSTTSTSLGMRTLCSQISV